MGRFFKFLSSLAALAALLAGCVYVYNLTHQDSPLPSPGQPQGVEQARFLLEHDFKCDSSTNRNTVCHGTLRSDAASTADFRWQVAGDRGASSDPGSGTIAAGSKSGEITLDVPYNKGCPFTVLFVDREHDASYEVAIHSVNGRQC